MRVLRNHHRGCTKSLTRVFQRGPIRRRSPGQAAIGVNIIWLIPIFTLPHTVDITHDRSMAPAGDIELTDSILSDSKLKSIVLIRNGGALISHLHLVNPVTESGDHGHPLQQCGPSGLPKVLNIKLSCPKLRSYSNHLRVKDLSHTVQAKSD